MRVQSLFFIPLERGDFILSTEFYAERCKSALQKSPKNSMGLKSQSQRRSITKHAWSTAGKNEIMPKSSQTIT